MKLDDPPPAYQRRPASRRSASPPRRPTPDSHVPRVSPPMPVVLPLQETRTQPASSSTPPARSSQMAYDGYMLHSESNRLLGSPRPTTPVTTQRVLIPQRLLSFLERGGEVAIEALDGSRSWRAVLSEKGLEPARSRKPVSPGTAESVWGLKRSRSEETLETAFEGSVRSSSCPMSPMKRRRVRAQSDE